MIIDTIAHLQMYNLLEDSQLKLIQDFCTKAVKEGLKEGKTQLCGEELYALVQIYETRPMDEALMEAHKKYLDLQYIAEGEEYFYIHDTSKCKIKEDQTPEKDFLFLECGKPDVKVKAGAGMFVLLFPQDAHMSCIQADHKEKVKKIVFKIHLH